MNDFTTKKQKPTAQEYLDAPLEQVVERLNNNPSALESEEALVQAVITVRAAKINERLASRLNWMTGTVALATFCLVVVPFISPSIEKKQLEEKLDVQTQTIELQKKQISQLTQSISALIEEQGKLAAQLEKHNQVLHPTTQPQTRAGG